jgi:hypothetical protein
MATPGFEGAGIWQCSVQRDEETSLYIGHCLNLHVKVAGRDSKEAWVSLKRVVKSHFEYCYENDRDGLRPTAKPLDFAEWSRAFEKAFKEDPNSVHFEEIVLELRVPKVAGNQALPLSCQGVELAQAAAAGRA